MGGRSLGARAGRALALLALASACSPSAPPPNILFVSLDTVRADFLTFRDPETASRLTGLATGGTVFTDAVSGSSWTLPAHVQMFTGMGPVLHGVDSEDLRIDPRIPTLPELLEEAGYYTAGVFTCSFLWGDYGFARGFDVYRSATFEEDLARWDSGFAPRGYAARARLRSALERDLVNSPYVVTVARRALERAPADAPVFLFAHFFDPHTDYVPPAPWDTKFDPDYTGDLDGRDFISNERIFDKTKTPPRQIGDRDLEHIKSLYRGEIAWTDQWVGALLDLFREHGRLDDTLVVVTSDHGEEFFEHGNRYHRHTLFDEVLRVPLLIVPPRARREGLVREVDAQVSLSDLMPTILDFAGIEAPPTASGRSLRGAMYGEPLAPRRELASLYLAFRRQDDQSVHRMLHALRTPGYKLLHWTVYKPQRAPHAEVDYYDLEADPGEQHPIRDLDDPRVAEAWRALREERAAVERRWRARAHSPEDERTTDVFVDFDQALKALGYLDAADAVELMPALDRPWKLDPFPPLLAPEPAGEAPGNGR